VWKKSSPGPPALQLDPFKPFARLPPVHVERKIAARWKEWEAWAIIHLYHRGCPSADQAAELLSLLDAGIEMRLIRRHQLDDPRMTDEVRGVLVQAAIEQRRKLRVGRHDRIGEAEHTSDFAAI
jgi:hypothetical protein